MVGFFFTGQLNGGMPRGEISEALRSYSGGLCHLYISKYLDNPKNLIMFPSCTTDLRLMETYRLL